MLQRIWKKAGAEPYSAPLTLSAANGSLQRVFGPEVVTSFRQMTTGLSYGGKLPPRIAVVAALQSEGVTYNALSMGLLLASDTAARVCVVDLNWWRPGLIAALDPALTGPRPKGWRKPAPPTPSEAALALAARPGSAQLAAGEAALDDVLLPTELPNLNLIPAGECQLSRRPALARSPALRTAVDELGTRFDHLIFDLPALLSTSDAVPLASLSDAACVVVRHGVTTTATVQLALDSVRHLEILGVILNQVSIRTPRWIRALVPQE